MLNLPSWTPPLSPNDRWFEIIGSTAYRTRMSLLPGDMNVMKGRMFGMLQVQDLAMKFTPALAKAASGSLTDAKYILGTNQKASNNGLSEDFFPQA